MTLREPVELVSPDELGSVHFIAIGGAGMSGIAEMFHWRGIKVSGSDQSDSATLRQLDALGITTYVGHRPTQLGDAQTVVVSSAIRHDNPELVEAQRRGLRIWHRSAALASLMLGRRGVAVGGTHGKTTTSAMISVMVAAAGGDPGYVIGAPLAATGRSAHDGAGNVFVVEADESDGTFLQYPSEIVVVTNVEADHLDNWGTPQRYRQGFERFATGGSVRAAVVCVDDAGGRELADDLRDNHSQIRLVTYGQARDADVRVTEVNFAGTCASATLVHDGRSDRIELRVPGGHNLLNVAASFAVGRLLGLERERLLAGARSFTGTLRRFQPVDEVGSIRIFDDYAHHPTELRAALSAARNLIGKGRLVACFQPHLFSRTADFAQEFGEALALADEVVVTDIYAAREDPVPGVTGRCVADAATACGALVTYVPEKSQLPAVLADLVRAGDVVMTLGAGDVTLVGPLLASQLRARDGA